LPNIKENRGIPVQSMSKNIKKIDTDYDIEYDNFIDIYILLSSTQETDNKKLLISQRSSILYVTI
jgi:hypothetical protein